MRKLFTEQTAGKRFPSSCRLLMSNLGWNRWNWGWCLEENIFTATSSLWLSQESHSWHHQTLHVIPPPPPANSLWIILLCGTEGWPCCAARAYLALWRFSNWIRRLLWGRMLWKDAETFSAEEKLNALTVYLSLPPSLSYFLQLAAHLSPQLDSPVQSYFATLMSAERCCLNISILTSHKWLCVCVQQ